MGAESNRPRPIYQVLGFDGQMMLSVLGEKGSVNRTHTAWNLARQWKGFCETALRGQDATLAEPEAISAFRYASEMVDNINRNLESNEIKLELRDLLKGTISTMEAIISRQRFVSRDLALASIFVDPKVMPDDPTARFSMG